MKLEDNRRRVSKFSTKIDRYLPTEMEMPVIRLGNRELLHDSTRTAEFPDRSGTQHAFDGRRSILQFKLQGRTKIDLNSSWH